MCDHLITAARKVYSHVALSMVYGGHRDLKIMVHGQDDPSGRLKTSVYLVLTELAACAPLL